MFFSSFRLEYIFQTIGILCIDKKYDCSEMIHLCVIRICVTNYHRYAKQNRCTHQQILIIATKVFAYADAVMHAIKYRYMTYQHENEACI